MNRNSSTGRYSFVRSGLRIASNNQEAHVRVSLGMGDNSMCKRFLLSIAGLTAVTVGLNAQSYQRKADIRGGGNPNQGKCTIEVVVDGAAEVEIRGDNAVLRNL